MTEPEAWREVARRFAEGEAPTSLCREALHLFRRRLVDAFLCDDMRRRVRGHVVANATNYETAWAYPLSSEYDEARCLAALWLALEAEEEA
jgi:hypothetical protein